MHDPAAPSVDRLTLGDGPLPDRLRDRRDPWADTLFWGSLALALGVAGVVAFPVNRWLTRRGRGHAVLHERHH